MAVAEWEDIWRSPMASQFIAADRHGLLKLAVLVNDYWLSGSAKGRRELLAEIRLQRTDFGLAPRPRAGLHWEVARADEAESKAAKRKAAPSKAEPAGPDPRAALDPRAGLRIVEGGKPA